VRRVALALCVSLAVCGCGLEVQSADLFLLTRAGQGQRLTILVNDSGTIRCNSQKTKPLSDSLLITARDLAGNLDSDAKAKLRIAAGPHSVYQYTIRLQDGTISFPDTAAAKHHELSQAELFTVQAAAQACGISA
jgi:hypothetical protein